MMRKGFGTSIRYQAVALFLLLQCQRLRGHGHNATLRGGHLDLHDVHLHLHPHPHHNHRWNSFVRVSEPSAADLKAMSAAKHDHSFLRRLAKLVSRIFCHNGSKPSKTVVPTYYHIIQSDLIAGPSSAQIKDQHDHLVEAFASTAFTFSIKEITFTKNNDWFGYKEYNTIQEKQMKSTLRRGGAESLNIYVNNGKGVCGYAYLPKFYKQFPWNDGIVINYRCFGGASKSQEGDNVVHEVGHWLGLFHAFSGCSEPGDGVSDTPLQDLPTSGCPTAPKNSCGQGNDLIDNFMDYSADSCRSAFTVGQARRMEDEWALYRAPPSSRSGLLF